MPSQTPIYALPYPTAGDPVWQGATQIQALAERLEAVLQAAGIAVAGGEGDTKTFATADLDAAEPGGTE